MVFEMSFCLSRMFPEMGVHPIGWSIRENTIRMDDLGVPLFTPILGNFHIWCEVSASLRSLQESPEYGCLPELSPDIDHLLNKNGGKPPL